MKWESLLKDWERAVREGRAAEIAPQLKGINGPDVPRPNLAKVAELARRANLVSLGLQLLHPVVRGSPRVPANGTPRECAEYAACLARAGSQAEAWNLLSRLEDKHCPEILLYRTYVLTTRWEYADVIPFLKSYVKHSGADSYLRLVGMVNLADALVYERRHVQVRALLSELLHSTSVRRLHLLHGNVLQVAGLDAVLRRKFSEAEKFLSRSEDVLTRAGRLDRLFAAKWRAVAKLLQTGNTDDIGTVRVSAVAEGHWETVRDCDRFLAIEGKDKEKFLHVYFGTPHPAFRARLVDDFGKEAEIPASYRWCPAGAPANASVFSLAEMKASGLVPRFLSALCEDFYRPARIASLFFLLHPEDFYDPRTSPHRVHEILRRLRAWIEESRLPLKVNETEGLYRLEATKPIAIEVRLQSGEDPVLERLRHALPQAQFSVQEACKVLKLSPRSVRRLLSEAAQSGGVAREGKGTATRYRFRA